MSFGAHITDLPQDIQQSIVSSGNLTAIRSYKRTCKELYKKVHFFMASDHAISNMSVFMCWQGLMAFKDQQYEIGIKEKNVKRFLYHIDIKNHIANRKKRKRFPVVDFETIEPKTLLQDNKVQDIATKLILYPNYCYTPNSSQKITTKSLLLVPKIDINLHITGGYTALMRACNNNDTEIVKILLAHPEVEVNAKNKKGQTALMKACKRGHREVVKILLDDPRVNLHDEDGNKAFLVTQSLRIAGILATHKNSLLRDKIMYGILLGALFVHHIIPWGTALTLIGISVYNDLMSNFRTI
jgi:hypothetical protein